MWEPCELLQSCPIPQTIGSLKFPSCIGSANFAEQHSPSCTVNGRTDRKLLVVPTADRARSTLKSSSRRPSPPNALSPDKLCRRECKRWSRSQTWKARLRASPIQLCCLSEFSRTDPSDLANQSRCCFDKPLRVY